MENDRLPVLRSVVENKMFTTHFDVLPVLTFLFNTKLISLSFYLWMRQKFMLGEPSLRILLDVSQVCKWNDLIYALYINNYARVAEELQRQQQQHEQHNRCKQQLCRAQPQVVPGRETISSTVHQFYIRIKENLDRAAIKNPKDFLNSLIKRFANKIQCIPFGSERREHIVDKLLVAYCLQLQLYNKPSDRYSVLREMSRVSTMSPSRADWDGVIAGKLAYTQALEGDVTTAEEYRQGMNFALCTSNASFFTFDGYYCKVMQKMAGLEQAPSEETMTRLLFDANTALFSLADEPDIVREHWSRMLLSAVCRCLLGVGINFSITDDTFRQNRTHARCRLEQLNQFMDGTGVRREMMYSFLMAVFLSSENIRDAIVYARRALSLSKEGTYREIERQNIVNFVQSLENTLESDQ